MIAVVLIVFCSQNFIHGIHFFQYCRLFPKFTKKKHLCVLQAYNHSYQPTADSDSEKRISNFDDRVHNLLVPSLSNVRLEVFPTSFQQSLPVRADITVLRKEFISIIKRATD